jgi:3-deoxy-D-manno-octulosonic-acid transferase
MPPDSTKCGLWAVLASGAMRVLYSLLLYLLLPVVISRLLWRSIKAARPIGNVGLERFGWFNRPTMGRSLDPRGLGRRGAGGGAAGSVGCSTTIPASHHGDDDDADRVGAGARATRRQVFHVYFPYDLRLGPAGVPAPRAPSRPADGRDRGLAQPLLECHRRGVFALLANARLSERSAQGYLRLPALCAQYLRVHRPRRGPGRARRPVSRPWVCRTIASR